VPGQTQVKKLIESLLTTSKIPHAFLFTGKEGIGKFHFAIKFIQRINVQFEINSSSTEKNLKLISNFSEPLVKLIYPLPRGKNENETHSPFEKLSSDELQLVTTELETKIQNPYHKISIPKANDIKINSIRDINKFLSYNYEDVKFRTVIIIDAHLMNEPSQNSLLKNLEEPPDGVIFILITPYPEQLRETIRSRCWRINFQPLDRNEISEILIKYYSVDFKLSQKSASFSNGSIETALMLIEYEIDKLLEMAVSFLRFSLGSKFDDALSVGSQFLTPDKPDLLKILISLVITWFGDVIRYRSNYSDIYYSEFLETIEKFNSKFPQLDLSSIMFEMDRLTSEIDRNINQNLILLKIVFELSMLISKTQTNSVRR
jgi:DNA polymerase-3 subunit delta'